MFGSRLLKPRLRISRNLSSDIHFMLALLLARSWSAWESVLKPISTGAVPAVFAQVAHAKPPANCAASALSSPVETNKFYGNLLVADAANPVFQLPYCLKVLTTGTISISHDDVRTAVAGTGTAERVQYYHAAFIQNIKIGATELGAGSRVQVQTTEPFATNVHLQKDANTYIEVPVVRGAAFVTTIFRGCTPVIGTQHAILQVNGAAPGKHTGSKFKLSLNNGQTWIVYVINAESGDPVELELSFTNQQLTASKRVSGVAFRVCELPRFEFDGKTAIAAEIRTQAEAAYDAHHQAYETGATFFADVDSEAKKGRYGFVWKKAGANKPLLRFCLPHHLDQFVSGSVEKTVVRLVSPTAGMMTGVVGDRWELNEPDVATIGQVGYTAVREVPANRHADILDALKKDVAGLKADKPDQNSWYNAGKHFMRAANFAVVADVLGEAELRAEVISWYKAAVAPFVDGTIPNKIVYETSWNGVVSRKGMDDSGADYGNGYYNDHHYHWGYFLSANSTIAKFDADFKTKISGWMDTLLRDVMNPSASDTKFPVFRSFDWFVGSCWSQGIFASADGKDEESTSKEINMHYGIMLWGRTSGKADILRLGQLSIAVAARTIRRGVVRSRNV
jgi:endo-1,3(4)-beta-glucanase